VRLPVPGPRDVWHVLERGADAVEQLLAAVPRVTALLDQAEALFRRVDALVGHIEGTATAADQVVERAGRVAGRADVLVGELTPLTTRLRTLLDQLEPPLTRLQPVLDRLAETTAPQEVDALVALVDNLPRLAVKMETDVLPVLDSLSTVSPDVRDMLALMAELNDMLAQIPGLSRVKRRIDDRQEAEGRR
jgi:ABC-type transporter Mla subunit MlaD